jgi:hypothetical protein
VAFAGFFDGAGARALAPPFSFALRSSTYAFGSS